MRETEKQRKRHRVRERQRESWGEGRDDKGGGEY